MQKIQRIVIGSVLVMGIVISGIALAAGPGDRQQRGFGSHRHHKNQGLMFLTKYLHQNIKVQVLSEITGQSAEAIQSKLKDQRLWTLMAELDIDRQAFRTAMRAQVRQLIKQAAESGIITSDQEKEIYEKMENRAKRRELVSRLIEKGLEDGTITQEEAQMLVRKRR